MFLLSGVLPAVEDGVIGGFLRKSVRMSSCIGCGSEMNVLPKEEPERRRSFAEAFLAREPRMQSNRRVTSIPRVIPGRKPARKMGTGNLLVVAVTGAVLF